MAVRRSQLNSRKRIEVQLKNEKLVIGSVDVNTFSLDDLRQSVKSVFSHQIPTPDADFDISYKRRDGVEVTIIRQDCLQTALGRNDDSVLFNVEITDHEQNDEAVSLTSEEGTGKSIEYKKLLAQLKFVNLHTSDFDQSETGCGVDDSAVTTLAEIEDPVPLNGVQSNSILNKYTENTSSSGYNSLECSGDFNLDKTKMSYHNPLNQQHYHYDHNYHHQPMFKSPSEVYNYSQQNYFPSPSFKTMSKSTVSLNLGSRLAGNYVRELDFDYTRSQDEQRMAIVNAWLNEVSSARDQ